MAARKNHAVQAQQDVEAAAAAERRLEDMKAAAERREALARQRWEAAGRPTSEESRKKIQQFTKLPKPSGLQHWRKVLADPNAPALTKRYAEEALARLEAENDAAPTREPGEEG